MPIIRFSPAISIEILGEIIGRKRKIVLAKHRDALLDAQPITARSTLIKKPFQSLSLKKNLGVGRRKLAILQSHEFVIDWSDSFLCVSRDMPTYLLAHKYLKVSNSKPHRCRCARSHLIQEELFANDTYTFFWIVEIFVHKEICANISRCAQKMKLTIISRTITFSEWVRPHESSSSGRISLISWRLSLTVMHHFRWNVSNWPYKFNVMRPNSSRISITINTEPFFKSLRVNIPSSFAEHINHHERQLFQWRKAYRSREAYRYRHRSITEFPFPVMGADFRVSCKYFTGNVNLSKIFRYFLLVSRNI